MSAFSVANQALDLATKTAATVAAMPSGGGTVDVGDFDATALTAQVNALTDKVNALTALVGTPTDGENPAPMLTAGAGASPGSPFAQTKMPI